MVQERQETEETCLEGEYVRDLFREIPTVCFEYLLQVDTTRGEGISADDGMGVMECCFVEMSLV